jgi:hypothetical protein
MIGSTRQTKIGQVRGIDGRKIRQSNADLIEG